MLSVMGFAKSMTCLNFVTMAVSLLLSFVLCTVFCFVLAIIALFLPTVVLVLIGRIVVCILSVISMSYHLSFYFDNIEKYRLSPILLCYIAGIASRDEKLLDAERRLVYHKCAFYLPVGYELPW